VAEKKTDDSTFREPARNAMAATVSFRQQPASQAKPKVKRSKTTDSSSHLPVVKPPLNKKRNSNVDCSSSQQQQQQASSQSLSQNLNKKIKCNSKGETPLHIAVMNVKTNCAL
jgi:hypothetical protein